MWAKARRLCRLNLAAHPGYGEHNDDEVRARYYLTAAQRLSVVGGDIEGADKRDVPDDIWREAAKTAPLDASGAEHASLFRDPPSASSFATLVYPQIVWDATDALLGRRSREPLLRADDATTLAVCAHLLSTLRETWLRNIADGVLPAVSGVNKDDLRACTSPGTYYADGHAGVVTMLQMRAKVRPLRRGGNVHVRAMATKVLTDTVRLDDAACVPPHTFGYGGVFTA